MSLFTGQVTRRRLIAPAGLRVPWWWWVAVIVVVEAAVVLLFDAPTHAQMLSGDGAEYQRFATNLLHHAVFSEAPFAPYYPGVARSPGYPAFLAALEWLDGSGHVLVQLVQFGLIGATAVLAGEFGMLVAGRLVGRLAALLCVTYLPFIWLAPHYLTEVLGTFCLTAVVLLLCRARRSDSVWAYAASGAALAVLCYVRPEFVPLAAPIALAVLVTRRRAGIGMSAVFLATLAVALLPWMVRNLSVTGGRLVPLAATSGSSILASADQYDGFISYRFSAEDWNRYLSQASHIAPVPIDRLDARGQVQADDRLRSAGTKIIRSLSLGTILSSLPARLTHLWGIADYTPPGRLNNTGYRLAHVQYLLLALLILIGLVTERRRLLRQWPLWIAAVYVTLLHVVFHVEARYTLPARPALMVYAAVGLVAAAGAARRGLASTAHRRYR